MDWRVFWGVFGALIAFSGVVALVFLLFHFRVLATTPQVVYSPDAVVSESEMLHRQLASGDMCTNAGLWLQTSLGHVRVTNYRCAMVADRRIH